MLISKYKVELRTHAIEGIHAVRKFGTPKDLQELKGHLHTLENVSFGLPLENIGDLDLSGCFKIYFGTENQFRIVYEIKNNTISILSVLAIGFREGYQVYQDASLERD